MYTKILILGYSILWGTPLYQVTSVPGGHHFNFSLVVCSFIIMPFMPFMTTRAFPKKTLSENHAVACHSFVSRKHESHVGEFLTSTFVLI